MAHQIPGSVDRGHGSPRKSRPAVLGRRSFLLAALSAAASLAACGAPRPAPAVTPAPSPAGGPSASGALGTPALAPGQICAVPLPTVVAPTPLPYPGYTKVEPETGLHVTGQAEVVDLAGYRLKVTGLVQNPLSLTYDDLRCLPKVRAQVKLECPGFFIDRPDLAGPTLASVLALARPQSDAKQVTLTSVTGYTTQLSLTEAQAEANLLAYELSGQLLPASHGFPVRAVLPTLPGGAWIKWLGEIKLS